MIQFLFPMDGDVVTPADGTLRSDGALMIQVELLAPSSRSLFVNGIPCRQENGRFVATVVIDSYQTQLVASDGAQKESITVFRFAAAWKKYRLAIDDIIWSMREIAETRPASLFDHPFFRLFRDLYQQYQTKTQLNIYFTDMKGFDLTQFPDTYRKEFEQSLDWLRLTFHARSDSPAYIYRNAPYDEVYRDFHRVTNQIIRFAGDEIWRTSANGLHFAETNREGARALRDCGSDLLVGYFIFDRNGNPSISYYLDKEQTARLSQRDFWVDRKEGIIFSRDKIVLDQTPLEKIPLVLDEMSRDLRKMGTCNLVTHEQYFYPHYKDYRPDYCQRIFAAVAWAKDNGYSPCFLSDCVYEDSTR